MEEIGTMEENVTRNEVSDEKPTEGETFVSVYAGTNPAPDKPGSIQIVARKDGKEASVYYDFGDGIDEMVELFGDDVVFSNARQKMKIGLQAAMRSYLKQGQDIGTLMEKFKPGVALEKLPTDMNKATESYFAGLSEDEQDAMIARLMSQKSA